MLRALPRLQIDSAPPPVDTVSASFVFCTFSFHGHSPLVYLPIRAFVFAAGIYIQILLHPLNDPI